jgi:phosphoglycolate phosphatase
MQCNICGGSVFKAYRGRANERCARCGSKARHRAALEVYMRYLWPENAGVRRILHLAPEACLHEALARRFGPGYVAADASPERYPHAAALKLRLPEDFAKLPDGGFDAVLHNHVLEHIPGHYLDHLRQFLRILRPGGYLIFSVPGPHAGRATEEGGELLATDAERLERFLQEDHFKIFGDDFAPAVARLPGADLLDDGVTDGRRREIAIRPGKAKIFVLRKEE